MSDKIQVLPDIIPDIKFSLEAQEQFANDKGTLIEHFAAIPSPIGLKEKGEYRRPDVLDVVASNGFIYKKVGEFRAVIVGNSNTNQPIDGGIYDNSTARLVLPKFYKKACDGTKKKEIQLLPGDRLYAKGIELKVPNYQRMDYSSTGVDRLQFPAKSVSHLVDSRNVEYTQSRHFKIDKDGHIRWINGRKNPGVDPDTGKGRSYSLRYVYLAFWYVHQLVNEIRIVNDVNGNPTRLPYHATIQREYVYYSSIKGDSKHTNEKNYTERTNKEPTPSMDDNKHDIKVDVRNFE